ncbi:hypothetical protein QF048_007599 [Streptomyces sp. W4I9-2]|nr:hypothetical protein [Streptomyces sp. W4I9-2]
MVRAMERVEEISAFALGRVNLSRVPVNRLSSLARYGQLSKAQTILRAPEPRRTALLTAVVRQLEAQAVDDALDLFAVLMANRLINPARRASDRERLAMPPQLEKAARVLAKASKILTEELDLVAEHEADLDVAALWAAVEEAVPRTAVAGAVATVEALVPEDDGSAEAAMREKLALRYNTVRPFLSLLGESDALGAAPAGRRILKAVRRLPALSRRRVKDRPPHHGVGARWIPAFYRSSTAHILRPSSAVSVPHETAPRLVSSARTAVSATARPGRWDRATISACRFWSARCRDTRRPPSATAARTSASVRSPAAWSASRYPQSCSWRTTLVQAFFGDQAAASSDQFADRRLRTSIRARAVPSRLVSGRGGCTGRFGGGGVFGG